MSYASIQIDFDAACAQAARLEGIAEQIRTLANVRMKDTAAQMSASWKGDSAAAYFAKAEKLQGDIAKTANKLDQIAGTIRATARRIYEAEQAALRLAEQRSGHS